MKTDEIRASSHSDLFQTLSEAHPAAELLLSNSQEEQQRQGYYHTLHEICHQPNTWLNTSAKLLSAAEQLKKSLKGAQSLWFTGSGSSEYAGECVAMVLQNELGIPSSVVGGGALLSFGKLAITPPRPGLMVSLARSGDSPESVGALRLILHQEPEVRHLVMVCNNKGRLANEFRGDTRVSVVALDDNTNDRSLVMTSSFTNLALAARSLGMLDRPEAYRELCCKLSGLAAAFLLRHFGTLEKVAALPFGRVVFLASGCRFGAARESALKMLESTAGRVPSMSETYLGFRHGPMSFAHEDTLVVCYLSSAPIQRAYESDLLRELNEKKLGMMKLVIGEDIPDDLLNPHDIALECPSLGEVGDENAAVIDVITGQLLAFFRCRNEGLRPDSPSDGTINRVVQNFDIHTPGASA